MLYEAAVAYETYQLEAGATAPMFSVSYLDGDDPWRVGSEQLSDGDLRYRCCMARVRHLLLSW